MAECKIDQIVVRTATTALDIKPIKEQENLVAYEYSLHVIVAGDTKTSVKCDNSSAAEENILKVKIPINSSNPVLSEINVGALNFGLRNLGSMKQLDPELVKQARECFAANLARTVVELTRKDNVAINPAGTLSTGLGNDLVPDRGDITGQVTLSSLDTIAGIIQQGIAVCRASKTR